MLRWNATRRSALTPLILIATLTLLLASLPVSDFPRPLTQSSPAPVNGQRFAHARVLPADLAPVAAAAIRDDTDAYTFVADLAAPDSFRANTPAQRLAAQFSAAGVQFTGSSADTSWGLHLAAAGSAESLASLPAVAPTVSGARLTYHRGDLTEWYANGPTGLEQGFTIATPPSERGSSPLAFRLTLDGVVPSVLAGNDLALALRDGTMLRYGDLRATDMTGRSLPARLALDGDALLITVDDAGAVYPVTVDPLIQQQRLTSDNPMGLDLFGDAVALSGDGNTAVIAAPAATLSGPSTPLVFIFVRSGTTWSLRQKIAKQVIFDALDLTSDGTIIVIGTDVYAQSGAQWAKQTTLTATGLGSTEPVRMNADGSVIVVGDTAAEPSHPGQAFVFVRTGGTFTYTSQRIIGSDTVAGDLFGNTVDVSGDGNTIIVSASSKGSNKTGAVYFFARANGTYTQQQEVTSPGATDFGASVSLNANGGTAAIGALGGTGLPGTVYIFVHGVTWALQGTLHDTDGSGGLGGDVAISDDGATVLAGAGPVNAGGPEAAYTFALVCGSWAQTQKLIPNDGAPSSFFGDSVALSGKADTALVAASHATVNGVVDAGAVYAYAGVPAGLQFYPLPSPIRLLDTRKGNSAFKSPGRALNAMETLNLPGQFSYLGVTIPAFAQAIVGNATVANDANSVGPGYATLYPGGIATPPTTSNLNYILHTVRPNFFTVGLGSDGSFNLFTSTGGDFIIDVTGFYGPAACAPSASGLYFHPLPQPVRLLDTRKGQTAFKTLGRSLNATETLNLPGRFSYLGATVPASAQALFGNATVDNSQNITPAGYATIYPGGIASPPNTSTLNFFPPPQLGEQVAPNAFITGLGADGSFNLFSSTGGDFAIDITGYFDANRTGGLLFNALPAPVRLLDTRKGHAAFKTPGATLAANQTVNVPGQFTYLGVTVPTTAQTLFGNATVANDQNGTPAGYATLYPGGIASPPNASNLNFVPGLVAPNAFAVGLGADGSFNLYTSTGGDFVIDISGYFS